MKEPKADFIIILFREFGVVNTVFGIMNGIALFVSPVIVIPVIGHKGALILGSTLFTLGTLLTRWTVEASLGLTILTYGVIMGLGNIALMPTYVVPMM